MPAALPTATLFGKRLRAARLARGWTQAELGGVLGLEDPNTAAPRISRYERGMHEADFKTIEKLSKALGLPQAYFFAPDVLAEAILVISEMPKEKQQEALALLKDLAGTSHTTKHPSKKSK